MKTISISKSRMGSFALAVVGTLAFSSCGIVKKITGSSSAEIAADAGPSVSITAPTEGTYITTANYENFTLTGFCTYNGGTVTVATQVPVFGSSPCTNNAWTVTLDVSFLFDGPLEFDVNHTGPLGETVPTFVRIYIKDTLSPTVPSITIGDGFTPPAGPAVVLHLSALNATKMYITNTAGCNVNGTLFPYATTANWMIQPVGNQATVYAQFLDDAGNKSACVSATIPTNFAPGPTLSITTPPAGTIINAAMAPAFHLGGACSENGRAVDVAGSVTATATCTGGAWEVVLNLSALADGALAFNATHTNAFGSSVSVFASFMKDTVPATVAITSPVAGSFVNLANQAAFPISGTCSENGRNVVLSAAASAGAVACAGGTWVTTLNLSGAPEGSVTVYADHSDAAGNPAVQASRAFVKDTVPPSGGSISINAGAATTMSTAVTLTLGAVGASEMVVTNTAGCLAGGAFEPYATTKAWTLGQMNGTATVYVAFRDSAGNVGPCVNDTIVHSNLALTISPTSISLPSNAAQTTTFTAAGGSGGYVFTVRSGDGAIGAATGIYTVAAGATGTTIVRVTDSSGAFAEATVVHAKANQLVFDGPIKAISIDADGNRYYGGNFTRVAGLMTPGLLGLDGAGHASTTFDPAVGFDGPVHAAIYLADGSLVLGGEFTSYRGAPANRIAHLSAAGVLDPAFSPASGANGFDGEVRALASDGDAIYVGGGFKKYRGANAPGLAKLNLAGILNTTFNPSVGANSYCMDAAVNAIGTGPGFIVVGGEFTKYRNQVAKSIAKINSATGALDSTFNPQSGANGFDGDVRAILINDTQIYVGGGFHKYKGASANGIVRLNLQGYLDSGFTPSSGANGVTGDGCAVQALALGPTGIYLGGDFTSYRGTVVNDVAKVNLDGSLDADFVVSGENGTRGSVSGLAFGNDSLYIAGSYTHYRGRMMNGLAKVNGESGAVDPAFNPTGLGFSREGGVPPISFVALSNEASQLVVGGDLVGALYEGTVTGRLAKVKPTGDLDVAFSNTAKVDAEVDAIAIASRTIYAGGQFRSVAGKTANRVAKLDQAGNLDAGFSPQSGANGTDGTVFALAVNQNTVYVGGEFKTYRGQSSTRLARVTSAGVLETLFDCRTGMDGTVRALAVSADGAVLYAGGDFEKFKGLHANHVAKINTANSSLDTTFNSQSGSGNCQNTNGFNGSVRVLTLDPSGKIYVGGRFDRYRGNSANKIVRLNPNGSLDSAFFVQTEGPGYCSFVSVDAIAVDSTGAHVFFGGRFVEANDAVVNHVAEVSTRGQVDPAFSPPAGPAGVNLLPGDPIPVAAIAIDGPRVHIGGEFTSYRAQPVQNLAIVDFAGAPNQ